MTILDKTSNSSPCISDLALKAYIIFVLDCLDSVIIVLNSLLQLCCPAVMFFYQFVCQLLSYLRKHLVAAILPERFSILLLTSKEHLIHPSSLM